MEPKHAMNDADRLAETLRKLSQVEEPSELVYGDTPIPTAEPPGGVAEAYSITVARRISTVLSRLSELTQSNRQRVLTPRGVLLELMDIVQHGLFLCLPTEMRHVGRERSSLASAYHTYVSARRIPVESMMEGLHTLTYVSVKLRLELVTLQLKHRLREEMTAIADEATSAPMHADINRAREEKMAALLVTETLLDDFIDIYTNALLLTPVISSAARAALRSPASASVSASIMTPGSSQLVLQGSHTLTSLIATLERYYYQFGDWTMLTANAATVAPISLTHVTKVAVDERKGLVACDFHRPSTDAPWGLLFNERGRLIGLDTSMRVGSRAEELHALLRCSQEGARVVAVNDVPVKPPRRKAGDGAAAVERQDSSNRAVLEAVQAASHHRKRLKLTLASENFRAATLRRPAELVFSCPAQGGEGASGQRAAILLHRLNSSTPWQFAIDGELMWFPPPPKLLSEEVRQFVRSFPYRLRVLAVNGVEVSSPVQVRDIVERVEVLLLELVVVPVSESPAHSRKQLEQGAVAIQVPVEEATPAPTVRTAEVTPADVSAIEQQVRTATQRLMLTQAQQEELREVPMVDLTHTSPVAATDGEGDLATAEAATTTGMEAYTTVPIPTADGGELDDAADQILQEMLRAAGVDTGDAAAAGALPKKTRRGKGKAIVVDDSQAATTTSTATTVAAVDDTTPCLFENDVRLVSFDGSDMLFRRTSAKHPWGIKITQHTADDDGANAQGRSTLPLRMLALPEPLPSSLTHPFLKRFSTQRKGWLIESINGKSAASNPKVILDLMRKATKMSVRLVKF